VLPDADNSPALCFEQACGFDVALAVRRQLRAPVVSVLARTWNVNWAHVPIAAVDEHRHLTTGENEVRGSPNSRDWPNARAISKAEAMHGAPDEQFRYGVTASVSLHDAPTTRGDGPRFSLSRRAVTHA
jgi:hypothetical protein